MKQQQNSAGSWTVLVVKFSWTEGQSGGGMVLCTAAWSHMLELILFILKTSQYHERQSHAFPK